MTEIVFDKSQAVTLIGKVETAGMAQYVRMQSAEASHFTGSPHDVVDRLSGERLIPFRDEQPGQCIASAYPPASCLLCSD